MLDLGALNLGALNLGVLDLGVLDSEVAFAERRHPVQVVDVGRVGTAEQ